MKTYWKPYLSAGIFANNPLTGLNISLFTPLRDGDENLKFFTIFSISFFKFEISFFFAKFYNNN